MTLVTGAKVPNPVILRPYRTFMEVTQPAISCVFRVRKGPELSLHEADGGEWRLFAMLRPSGIICGTLWILWVKRFR